MINSQFVKMLTVQGILLGIVVTVVCDLPQFLDESDIPIHNDDSPNLDLLVVTRHGTFKPLPSSSKEDDNKELSEQGEKLMQRVGKLIERRYRIHINNVLYSKQYYTNPISGRVTASDTSISKKSAEEIIKGMYDPTYEYSYHILDLKMDSTGASFEQCELVRLPTSINVPNQDRCKSLQNLLKRMESPKTKVYDPVLTPIFSDPGPLTLDKIYQEYEHLQMQLLNGEDVPEWAKGIKGKTVLKTMKRLVLRRMKAVLGDKTEIWRFFVNHILKNTLEEFSISKYFVEEGVRTYDQKLPSVTSRFHFHVVDDYLMLALVWWLRLDNEIERKFRRRNIDDMELLDSKGNVIKTIKDYELIDYYPQVGDALIIENYQTSGVINRQLETKVYYLRTVEESGSVVGFKPLPMTAKLKEMKYSYAPGAYFSTRYLTLNSILFTSYKKFEECCVDKNLCE